MIKNSINNIRFMQILTITAILLTIIVAGLSAYLLLANRTWAPVPDLTPEEIAQGVQPLMRIYYTSYLPAIFPLIASALLIFGLMKKDLYLIFAWVGLAILFVFSGLFLFSSGAGFLPLASLILAFLLAITILQRKEAGMSKTT